MGDMSVSDWHKRMNAHEARLKRNKQKHQVQVVSAEQERLNAERRMYHMGGKEYKKKFREEKKNQKLTRFILWQK